jgi:hypothetical protein
MIIPVVCFYPQLIRAVQFPMLCQKLESIVSKHDVCHPRPVDSAIIPQIVKTHQSQHGTTLATPL